MLSLIRAKKNDSKIKCTYREYHVQENADVANKEVKMYCNKKQFPVLPFCVPHPNPHGARGFSKHSNLRLYPKQGDGICAIFCIKCACVTCISILVQHCIYGISSKKKESYQLVTNFSYWPVIVSFNNCNFINL